MNTFKDALRATAAMAEALREAKTFNHSLMIEELKKLLGEERLARLAEMPNVKERQGLEAHLQEACKQAETLKLGPARALVIAIRSAGGRPTQDDVVAASNEVSAKRTITLEDVAQLKSDATGAAPEPALPTAEATKPKKR